MENAENPKYSEDSYVTPLVGHMPNQKGNPAKVIKAVTGTFYILDFNDGEGPHKWYEESELKLAKVSNEELMKAAEKARKGTLEDRAKYASMKHMSK